MTATELLSPRFEVIEGFPNSPYEIGDLLLFSEDKNLILYHALVEIEIGH